MNDTKILETLRGSDSKSRRTVKFEGLAVVATAVAFAALIGLSAVTVPSSFTAKVGGSHLVVDFKANSKVSLNWQSVGGVPTTFQVTNVLSGVPAEEQTAPTATIVYQATSSSGSVSFVSNGGSYDFSNVGSGAVPPTVTISGIVASPLL